MSMRALRAWWVGIVLATIALPVYAQDEAGCGPFSDDPETTAAAGPTGSPEATSSDATTSSEIVVVLPRLDDGSVGAADLELGDGATIAESRWSPVLCATMVRIVGPPGADPTSLIVAVPSGAAAVPNDVYRTAATPEGPQAPSPDEVAPARERKADPYRALQYGLDRAGVDAAMPITTGNGGRVALLDSRPALDHPDLAGVELLETGRVDERPGVHGTLIAGILAATPENGFGIAGLSPGAQVVAVPVCRAATTPGQPDLCRLYDLVLGADAAWAAGLCIINLSLVGPANVVLERTVSRLDSLGAVVVAAAGNEGVEEPRYPAAYSSVVAVGAVDRDGERWERSNQGLSVEITAPGVEIVTTVPGGGFTFTNGTSLATAHVTGLLALLTPLAEDAQAARQAMFAAGHARPDATRTAAALPTACEALARLGHECPTTP